MKKGFTKNLTLRIITLIGLIFVIFIAVGLVKEIVNRRRVNNEIKRIQNEITGLEMKNKELSGLVDYLNTDAFKEIQARQDLGLQKEGEKSISIESMPENVPANIEQIAKTEEQNNKSNVVKWWDYLFEE